MTACRPPSSRHRPSGSCAPSASDRTAPPPTDRSTPPGRLPAVRRDRALSARPTLRAAPASTTRHSAEAGSPVAPGCWELVACRPSEPRRRRGSPSAARARSGSCRSGTSHPPLGVLAASIGPRQRRSFDKDQGNPALPARCDASSAVAWLKSTDRERLEA